MKRPSKSKIVAAQRSWLAAKFREWSAVLEETCWACSKLAATVKAHVVARSAGGGGSPHNFLLLCERCHGEQPDTASREAQIAWVLHSPHHEDDQQTRAMLKAINATAAKFDVDVDEWRLGLDGRLADVEIRDSASAGHRNRAANARWAIYDDLLAWAKRQPEEIARSTRHAKIETLMCHRR